MMTSFFCKVGEVHRVASAQAYPRIACGTDKARLRMRSDDATVLALVLRGVCRGSRMPGDGPGLDHTTRGRRRTLHWQDTADEVLRKSCQAARSIQDRLLLSPESVFTV
ncbi:hypothetical protein [Bordetella sp. 2513F-2]